MVLGTILAKFAIKELVKLGAGIFAKAIKEADNPLILFGNDDVREASKCIGQIIDHFGDGDGVGEFSDVVDFVTNLL